MKKLLVTSIAVLLLATGTAHAYDPETEKGIRFWCYLHPDTAFCAENAGILVQSRADLLALAEKRCKEKVAANRGPIRYDICDDYFEFLDEPIARTAELTRDTCQTDEECAAVCIKKANTKREVAKCLAIIEDKPDEQNLNETFCLLKHGQDGEVLETPGQQAAYDRCMKEQVKPAAHRFRRWQMAWQCNDLRVTVTAQDEGVVNYDIAGTIWGGINFTQTFDLRHGGRLFMRGVPCVPLR
jgi:hypothetical protein